MLLKSLFFIFLGLFLQESSSVKSDPFVGAWEGYLTQEKPALSDKYDFIINIQKSDSGYVATSKVNADEAFAIMSMEGKAYTKEFIVFKDLELKEHTKLEGMEWCTKKYQLILKQDDQGQILEGNWQGQTSINACVPGNVFLRRAVNRA